MTQATAFSLLASVLLTASSQLLMKFGMTSSQMQSVLARGARIPILLQVAQSPWIVGGLSCFALSVGLWLGVLAKLNVSQAYPCVAFGFVLTMLGGHFLFGEIINPARVAGLALIIAGVGVVAVS